MVGRMSVSRDVDHLAPDASLRVLPVAEATQVPRPRGSRPGGSRSGVPRPDDALPGGVHPSDDIEMSDPTYYGFMPRGGIIEEMLRLEDLIRAQPELLAVYSRTLAVIKAADQFSFRYKTRN